jgi:hypothetical protein
MARNPFKPRKPCYPRHVMLNRIGTAIWGGAALVFAALVFTAIACMGHVAATVAVAGVAFAALPYLAAALVVGFTLHAVTNAKAY